MYIFMLVPLSTMSQSHQATLDPAAYHGPVVELSFRKGRVQSVNMRALCTQIFTDRAYTCKAFFSGSKGHFNIGSFGPV